MSVTSHPANWPEHFTPKSMISAAWYVPPWSPLPSTREDLVYVYVVFGRQPRGSSHLHPCALQGQRRSRNQPQPARAAGLWLQHACQCGNRGKNEAPWCPGPRQPLWVQEPRLVTLVSGWEGPAAEPAGAKGCRREGRCMGLLGQIHFMHLL